MPADTCSQLPSTTVCIATVDRPHALARALSCWRSATVVPAEIRVVDASDGDDTRDVVRRGWEPLRVVYLRSPVRSAARQRNLGAEGCTSDIIVFCDDDSEPPPEALEKLLSVFGRDPEGRVGGVAGTIEGMAHRVPRPWLRRYYRVLAGYDHEHYGGHVFGPAINLLPTDRPDDPALYPAQWLNSTLVAYRTAVFQEHRFPDFGGYSFQEDVNLSSRVARSHRLYFHRGVRYRHGAEDAPYKRDARRLASMRVQHRWHNAAELLNLRGGSRLAKFLLSLTVDSVLLAGRRPAGWRQQIMGSWGGMLRSLLGNDDPPEPQARGGAEALRGGGREGPTLALAIRAYHGVASRLRNRLYRRLGVEMGGYVWMRGIEIPRNWPDIRLGAGVGLDRGVVLLCSGPIEGGKLTIGDETYVNRYTMFDAHRRIEIGARCMIGPYCYLTDSDHGMGRRRGIKRQPMRSEPVILEDEVWLGANVVVLKGVRVGRGAVVGAGSVVTADIPPNAVAVGAPARVLRTRE